jgi:Protein of unknown function (DUF2868)
MHESALRTVFLIRSIDEGDKAGDVLSLAERAEATRTAAQSVGPLAGGLAGPSLPAGAQRLIVRRAELLLDKLQSRSPVIERILALAGGASRLGSLILLVAFAVGVGMSALDGSQRVDVLSFPLLGLIGWNLLVYLMLLATWFRPKRKHNAQRSPLWTWYARFIRGRSDALLRHSSRFNVPLTEAMHRFAVEWAVIAQPLLLLRAQRLFHLGAVCLALGLSAGLYVRGLVLRYEAGWDSTFLDAGQVHMLLGGLYGPAAALSGSPLPSLEQTQALRWSETAGGAPAAPFIHWIALTATLYIVLPRLLLAFATSSMLWRQRRNPPLPAAFMPYARAILRESGVVSGLSASVITYAYAPTSDALVGLRALLSDALGGEVKVEVRGAVAYGEEDGFSQRLNATPLTPADCQVLLMSLSSTPESENHGAMIGAMQRELARRRSGLLLVIDGSPYAARLRDDASLAPRMAERTRAWREFADARQQPSCIVDLARLRPGEAPDDATRDGVRDALRLSMDA